jgi:predicted dehydrogenase
MTNQHAGLTRRELLVRSAVAGGAMFLPSRILGRDGNTPPSEKLNMACVGVGGMGWGDLQSFGDANIVAICDVDDRRAAQAYAAHPNVPKFKDYRKMLDKVARDIDAVSVSTPDHMHYPIALAAMELGKHVYVQKPLANTIAKARKLTELARQRKLVTQMGIQMHSSEGIRLIREWIDAGIVGTVKEVACWTNRPGWPQGMTALPPAEPVPPELDWPLWQGNSANYAYNHAFLPSVWRGWCAFGAGALGDMGTHIFDFVSYALDLSVPSSIEAQATGGTALSYPMSSKVIYEFPARAAKPPVRLTWYDGGELPPRPPELEPERKFGGEMSGCLIYGDKATILLTDYSPRIIPEAKMQALRESLPPKTIPRPKGSHYQNFIRACKGEETPATPFDYAGPLTEFVLAGAIAQRLPGRKLVYDPVTMSFPGHADATALVRSTLATGA